MAKQEKLLRLPYSLAFIGIVLVLLFVLNYFFRNGQGKEVAQLQACSQDREECVDGSFVKRTGPSCEFEKCPNVPTCRSIPELQLSQQELDLLEKKIKSLSAQNQLGKIFSLSAPDMLIDCTDSQKLIDESPWLDPASCKSHPKEKNLALYAVGFIPEGTDRTQEEASFLVENHTKEFGPFLYNTSFAEKQDCSVSFVFTNEKSTSAVRINAYKRLVENSNPVLILTPTLYTPESIGELILNK